MRENEIERYLTEKVKCRGGKCWKWVSPGRAGVPDRIILFPQGVVAFVETKAPGKRERALQEYVQRILREMGFTVYSSVDSKTKVDELLADMEERTGVMRNGV